MIEHTSGITIGLMGPIETKLFLDILGNPDERAYPKGIGGTPLNLLVRELHQRGYNLVLFSLDPSIDKAVKIHGERITIYFGPIRTKPARDFFSEEIKWLTKSMLEQPLDILHAHWTYEFALAAQATGLPCLVTSHDAPFNILKHNFIPYRIARTLMACKAIWNTQYLSAVSPYVANHLRMFMFYRKPIRVICNGLPEIIYNHVSILKSPCSPIVFATILSGWTDLKNGKAAIRAFALLRQTQPECRLIMFGTGHGIEESAEQWAKSQNLHEGIEFVGQVPYEQLIRQLCDKVDILVHPSLEESQGMTLIEAMAMGIPVIAGQNSGAVPWTLDYGKAGILVDITQPKQLAEAMLRLVKDSGERKRIGQAGLTHAKEHFHIRVVTDAYLQAYSDILAEKWT